MPETDLKFAPHGAKMRVLGATWKARGGGGGASHQSSSVPLPALFRETLSLYSLTHLAGLIMFLSWLWEMAYVHGSDFIFLSRRKPWEGCAVSQSS